MKKKIIFAIATSFFAVATMFNMNMVQSNSAGDISLENIMIMQKAEAELSSYHCYPCGWVCRQMTPGGYPIYIQGWSNY